jgi:beta-lactamase superfamily II metal-dependent hydrolase
VRASCKRLASDRLVSAVGPRQFTELCPSVNIEHKRGDRMSGEMTLTIWDVEHGACATLQHSESNKLAMIDSGHNDSEGWYPSEYIKDELGRGDLDYLFITNADHDHLSDLDGLWENKVNVKTLIRSKGISVEDLRKLKLESAQDGHLSDDIERFLTIHGSYTHPVPEPFNDYMGGVTFKSFWNNFPDEKSTNNLSMAVFFQFGSLKILFPGDLERSGWLRLLGREDFRAELDSTTVLVASHHGRESGFCAEVFEQADLGRIWKPWCVAMSDKYVEHKTQEGMAAKYGLRVRDEGIQTSGGNQRWVLTTRQNGWIRFRVTEQNFEVDLEVDCG